MTTLSLREAAEQAGVSKSTVFRAIQSGRLSAKRDDLGNFEIDPAEVHRVYPLKPEGKAERDIPTHAGTRDTGRDAPASKADHDMAVRLATAEAQLAGLKELLEAERKRGEELRNTADKWERQAERLTLALAAPKPVEVPAVIPMPGPQAVEPVQAAPVRTGWWPFRRAG